MNFLHFSILGFSPLLYFWTFVGFHGNSLRRFNRLSIIHPPCCCIDIKPQLTRQCSLFIACRLAAVPKMEIYVKTLPAAASEEEARGDPICPEEKCPQSHTCRETTRKAERRQTSSAEGERQTDRLSDEADTYPSGHYFWHIPSRPSTPIKQQNILPKMQKLKRNSESLRFSMRGHNAQVERA